MKKERVVIVALVVLLVSVSIGLIISLQKKQWTTVKTWYGSQTDYKSLTTESFPISGEEWRVTWSSNFDNRYHFDVKIYDANDNFLVREISTTSNLFDEYFTGHGQTTLNKQGRFYIQFLVQGDLDGWSLTVSEFR